MGHIKNIHPHAIYGKTNSNTNPDRNRYRRRCPDPNAMVQKKGLQIKTEEDGNFKAEKYKIEIEVNILNITQENSNSPDLSMVHSLYRPGDLNL